MNAADVLNSFRPTLQSPDAPGGAAPQDRRPKPEDGDGDADALVWEYTKILNQYDGPKSDAAQGFRRTHEANEVFLELADAAEFVWLQLHSSGEVDILRELSRRVPGGA
jgi:hypothetical protein